MMLPVTSISNSLPRVASSSFGEQAQFERALAQAADSMKNDTASTPVRTAPISPPMDVHRAAPTSPLKDRVLQTISAICPDSIVAAAAPNHKAALISGAPPGPSQKLPVEDGAGTERLGIPQGGHDFDVMVADLRDLYNGVTQVALVSKGISGITSSVNKLLKEG
ncbi:nodulation protein NolB [Sinorhizobium fredii]|uniref:nodulation protein NolB n=1 Tax=Rhizobium fredii TaxID=380 RepID=UPI00055CA2FF|nr:nodulation protein NolB [Sinorhizobium fredii]